MFIITLTFKIWINNMILNKSAGELASGQLRLGSTCLNFVVLMAWFRSTSHLKAIQSINITEITLD